MRWQALAFGDADRGRKAHTDANAAVGPSGLGLRQRCPLNHGALAGESYEAALNPVSQAAAQAAA